MKKIINIFSMLLVFMSVVSCSDWLDVQPKSEIKSEQAFESESGFKDALIGAYLLMTDSRAYGGEMTYGIMEAFGQQYNTYSASSRYYYAVRYNFTRFEEPIKGMWAASYTVIANLNNILENLELKKNMLQPSVYAIIKGEALGLRAYIHFDLLRIFSHGDLRNRPEYMNKLSIPYLTKYDKQLSKQLTIREVLDNITNDMIISRELLDANDPYGLAPKEDDFYLPNEDKFFDSRNYRFNYWAATCALARVYMWEGNFKNALPLTELFVEKGGQTSWVTLSDIDVSDEKKRDLTFSKEHVFCLEISGVRNLFSRIKPSIDPLANGNNSNVNLFYHTTSRADKLFEITNGGTTDYRYRRLYNRISHTFTGWSFYKFWEVEGVALGSRMPLIRKSEMYYMAAECQLEAGNRTKAVEYINTVRKYRGIAPAYNISVSLDHSKIMDEITKEYQKDLLCEGQMFYYYKRLGFTTLPNTTTKGSDAIYVIPMPKNDINIGGLEDNKK